MNLVLPALVQVAYLAAVVLFMVGLHYLRSPASAIRGNRLAAVGMLLAVVVTLLDHAVLHLEVIVLGLMVGGLIGAVAARRV
jgi:NAD(P) transhydrogenase subunit beta